MRNASLRPLTLGDLIILVAAVAAGFALQRWVETPVEPAHNRVSGAFAFYAEDAFEVAHMRPASNWFDYLWLRQPSYLAFAMTAALVVLRWRHPRLRARRILRQPGAVACLAVVLAMGVGFLNSQVMSSLRPYDLGPNLGFLSGRGTAWNSAVHWVSAVVAGVWASLALRRQWRPERSWLDRAGRLLGWYWLLGVVIAQLLWPALDAYLPTSQDHRP